MTRVPTRTSLKTHGTGVKQAGESQLPARNGMCGRLSSQTVRLSTTSVECGVVYETAVGPEMLTKSSRGSLRKFHKLPGGLYALGLLTSGMRYVHWRRCV